MVDTGKDDYALRVLAVEPSAAIVEAELLRAQLEEAKKAETKWLRLLEIACGEWEGNNGRIIDGRNPHWTVMLRRALKKRSRDKQRVRS